MNANQEIFDDVQKNVQGIKDLLFWENTEDETKSRRRIFFDAFLDMNNKIDEQFQINEKKLERY